MPCVRQGNSLKDNGYSADINKISHGIEKWGRVLFKKSFHNTGKTLEIGRQKDSSSCGICVVNSIERCMFGAPLFTHNERNALRVYYFTRAVEFLVDGVRFTIFNTRMTLTLSW